MELGQRIRRQRQRLYLTLNELASRSGISRAMISGVERGDRSPTIRVLCQIATGLECSVSSLIDAGSAPGARIVRANERSRFVDGETGAIRELLSPGLLDRGFELLRYEIPPGKTVGPFPPAAMDTIEHITLMSGRVDCTVDGEMHALRAGDSLTYSLVSELSLRASGAGPAVLILALVHQGSAHPGPALHRAYA